MTKSISTELNNTKLSDLTSYITKEYYESAYINGKQAIGRINHLKQTDDNVGGSEILHRYEQIVGEMQKFNTQRLVYFVPYLKELVDKNEEGHNCSTCSGKCDMHHTARLLDFNLSLEEIKNATYRERDLLTNGYNGVHVALQQVHQDIKNLNEILSKLFIIEQTTLLPKIKEAQKKINATS
jgi:hypothetical protein